MKTEAGGLRIARLLLFLALAFSFHQAQAAEDGRGRVLAQDPEWLRLLHYKRSPWSGKWASDAVAEGFFLSARGRVDPAAELEADVAAFSSPIPIGAAEHPRCRFPARAAWLERRLGLEFSRLAPADCRRFEEWRNLMDAGGVSLIFASSYLNNPSSMFGHTFLRLERRATGEDQRLRDNTLNFAAETGKDGGALFAVKGLLGLYPGKYTMMPYYMKIQKYGNMENRDLWEYRLDLSSAEVDRLAAHAWEMGQATFPYLFFSKNCSYQLLPALEAAAPRLTLMPGSPPVVAPIDALRVVRESRGLVKEVVYRPSHATVMRERRALLSATERRAARAYAEGRTQEGDFLSARGTSSRKALILDSAADYLLYKKGFSPDVPEDVRLVEHSILVRRARIADPPVELPRPAWAAPPEEGHHRRRLTLGGGARRGGAFMELSWRPGYHDLLDRQRGFVPGAGIETFSWRLRYDPDERRLFVRDLRVVEILSAAPWDPWARKPSWSLGMGLDTAFELGREASRSMIYEGHAGTGLAAQPAESLHVFGLVGPEGAVGSPLREGWRVGGSVRGGVVLDLGARTRVLLDGALVGQVFGDKTAAHRLRVGLNWAPSRDLALRAEGFLRGHYREAGLYAVLYH